MIVIVKHDNNNLITNIYTSNNPKSLIKKLGLEEQEYKIFPIGNINFKNGGDIRKFNDNSTLKSISEQVELGLVTIAEDEILENDTIRKLTEEELRELFPEKYPSILESEKSTEKTINQAIQEKGNEIKNLKDQYLDADLDDNEPLKMDLKKQIQIAKQELAILQSELSTEPIENDNE